MCAKSAEAGSRDQLSLVAASRARPSPYRCNWKSAAALDTACCPGPPGSTVRSPSAIPRNGPVFPVAHWQVT